MAHYVLLRTDFGNSGPSQLAQRRHTLFASSASPESQPPGKSGHSPSDATTAAASARHKTIPVPVLAATIKCDLSENSRYPSRPDRRIGLQPISRQETPHASILQPRQHDGAAFRLALRLHAQNVELQSRLVCDLFRQRLGRNAILGLMSQLHKDLRPRPNLKPAIAQLHFLRLRLQLHTLVARQNPAHKRASPSQHPCRRLPNCRFVIVISIVLPHRIGGTSKDT